MSRTGRGRERPRAEIAVVRVLEKRLGALPVVAEFGRRLRIAEIVDELCPVRPVAWITHGEVIEALVANRLTAAGRAAGQRELRVRASRISGRIGALRHVRHLLGGI